MALPVTIPNTFANATSSIPLSQLDTNFSTLANAVNGLNSGSETLANLKATTANVGVLTVTGNATIGDASTDTVTLNSTLTANTAVIFAAGTSAAPSITTTGDLNTGIFFPAADTIAFAEGGAEAMRIDSSGNVGIGTSSPLSRLSAVGSGVNMTGNAYYTFSANQDYTNYRGIYLGYDSSGQIGLVAAGGASNSILSFWTIGSTWGERMRIDSSGNVGIGTSSPGAKFQVKLATDYNIGFNTAAGIARISCFNDAVSASSSLIINGADLRLTTSDTERARITSGGYFKASDDGSYAGSTGTYHEFVQSANDINLYMWSKFATYSASALRINAVRGSSTAYNFLFAYSGNEGDLEFQMRGDGNAYADGTWNNNGADYAEFFESANGQALTLGATVVLDGNKVREATDQDPASAIIGVVRPKEPSKASMVVGNTAWNKWANKYLTDDFDRYIMEDHDVVEWEEQVLEREAVAAVEAVVDEEGNEVSPAVPAQEAVYKTKQHSYESHNVPAGITVPADAVRKTHDDKGNKFQHYKLNPAWDKDAEYVNRENRPEWNIIGLLGQVKILKGQPIGDRWIKMRDVSATVEEWMIR